MNASYNQLFIPQMREEVTSQSKNQDPDRVLESLYKSPEYLSRKEKLRKAEEEELRIKMERSKAEAILRKKESQRRAQEIILRAKQEEKRANDLHKAGKVIIHIFLHIITLMIGIILGLMLGWCMI